MKLHNIKAYLVFLKRNKLYTVVNILGLSISLSICILLFSYLYSEFTVDKFQENRDDIYLLANETNIRNSHRIGKYLQDKLPEIKNTCSIYETYRDVFQIDTPSKEIIRSRYSIFVDSSFLDIFSYKLIYGNKNKVLKNKNGILLSKSFSHSAFGNTIPVGSTLSYTSNLSGEKIIYVVEGIIEDFTDTILYPVDIIFNSEALIDFNPGALSTNYLCCNSLTFLQSTPNVDLRLRESDVLRWFKKDYWIYKDDCFLGPHTEVNFIPMSEIYFSDLPAILDSGVLRINNRDILMLFLSIAIVILIFSVFNYINLTVAQTGFRAKEMAVNKLYGASSWNIKLRMCLESEIMILISLFLALFIALSIEPYLSSLLGQSFNLKDNLNFINFSIIFLFMILIGITNAYIPSLYISRYKPIDVVKGEFRFKSKMLYSKIFIIVQVAITVVLIVFSLTMNRQIKHLLNFDYGYNSKNIICVNPTNNMYNYKTLISQINQIPGVENIGLTSGIPLYFTQNISATISKINKEVDFKVLRSDIETVKILGYQIIQDNKLADKDAYWVNEKALAATGLNSSAKEIGIKGSWNAYTKNIKIAGIFKDVFLSSTSEMKEGKGGYEPMLLNIEEDVKYPSLLLVKTETKSQKIIMEISKILEKLDLPEPIISYLDDDIKARADRHIKLKNIVLIFTIIALIISLLGLFAMSTYFSIQASKEIAIRKISGSTSTEVLLKIINRFMKLVAIAYIIACPIAYILVNNWLKAYTYRISLGVLEFLSAAIIILLITFITVYWQSRLAANTNPIKTLEK